MIFSKLRCRRFFTPLFFFAVSLVLPASVALAESVYDTETDPQVEEAVAARAIDDGKLAEAISLMNAAQEAEEADRIGRAIRLYRRVTRRYATTAVAPDAHYQLAELHMRRRQWDRAFSNLQEIVDSFPDFPRFNDVIERQYKIATALRDGARLRLFWIVPGFRSTTLAVEYYTRIVGNAPHTELAPRSLLHAARLEAQRGRLDEAIDLFDRFVNEYPDHELAPDAYLELAAAFSTQVQGPEHDQGATRESISYYEDFTILHQEHARVGEAEEGLARMHDLLAESRVALGDFYFRYRRNFHAARVFYNEAITIAPDSPSAEKARMRLEEVDRRAEARGDEE